MSQEAHDLIKNLFGTYKNPNFDKINKYTIQIQNEIQKQQTSNLLYFKGDNELKIYDFLKNKRLNNLPMSTEEVFKDSAFLVQNLPNWSNPGTMINVIPPVNLATLAISNVIRGLNANFAQDTYAGFSITAELEVSKYISDLVGWQWEQSIGTFTFGGKGTNLYATKIALSKCDKNSSKNGCERGKYFVLTSKTAHPCHYEVCNWLGIGKECCIEIPCLKNGSVDLYRMEQIIHAELQMGKIFLGCNLNGGSTNELYVDPIKEIAKLVNKIVAQYQLPYRPHIHVDSVIGWVFLFFNKYNFLTNPLKISKPVLTKIQSANKLVRNFKYADSMGIDFHKTGFCPYISSLFLCKRREDYFTMDPSQSQTVSDLQYGNYNPYHTTLELTRPSTGAISALYSLKTLGISGFQQIYAQMIESANLFRQQLSQNTSIEILNPDSCWLASLFIIKPKKYTKLSLSQILQLPEQDIQNIKNFNVNYANFIQNKARKSECNFIFTSSRSHKIDGTDISLGTLKAYPMSVFFDKQTAISIVKEINQSIQDFSLSSTKNKENTISISDDMVYRKG